MLAISGFKLVKFVRDDEEWFKHRQILNNCLLKDYRWIEDLTESSCDDFVAKVKRLTSLNADAPFPDLEKELYLWSTYCKSCQQNSPACNFLKSKYFSDNFSRAWIFNQPTKR